VRQQAQYQPGTKRGEAPTYRQLEVIRFIWDRTCSGEVPTIREICVGVGVNSTNAVQSRLRGCMRHGLIEQANGKSRSIRLTEVGRRALGIELKRCKLCGSQVAA